MHRPEASTDTTLCSIEFLDNVAADDADLFWKTMLVGYRNNSKIVVVDLRKWVVTQTFNLLPFYPEARLALDPCARFFLLATVENQLFRFELDEEGKSVVRVVEVNTSVKKGETVFWLQCARPDLTPEGPESYIILHSGGLVVNKVHSTDEKTSSDEDDMHTAASDTIQNTESSDQPEAEEEKEVDAAEEYSFLPVPAPADSPKGAAEDDTDGPDVIVEAEEDGIAEAKTKPVIGERTVASAFVATPLAEMVAAMAKQLRDQESSLQTLLHCTCNAAQRQGKMEADVERLFEAVNSMKKELEEARGEVGGALAESASDVETLSNQIEHMFADFAKSSSAKEKSLHEELERIWGMMKAFEERTSVPGARPMVICSPEAVKDKKSPRITREENGSFGKR